MSFIGIMLSLAAIVWARFDREFGFTAAISPDGVRIRRGLTARCHVTIPRGASMRFALPSPSFGASSTGTAWISRRRGMRLFGQRKDRGVAGRRRLRRAASRRLARRGRPGHRDGGSVAGGQRSRCLLGVPVRGEAGRPRDSAHPGQRAHPGPAAVRAPRLRPDRHRAGDSRRLVDAQVLPDPPLAHPIRLPPPGPPPAVPARRLCARGAGGRPLHPL